MIDYHYPPSEPTGYLSAKTYRRLYQEMWRYGNDSNWVERIDTVGTKLIVYVSASYLANYDSASYRDRYATPIAFNVLQYGFMDEYTGEWDADWKVVDLLVRVGVDSTQHVFFEYRYNLWGWFNSFVRNMWC
ncbi:hypothetical protein GCM10011379_07070 [Filimonas zeae]|uniref:Uncharacterized protein n=2 Tax=Filimonas zeae TaxID=1737353 RepID=A0A917IQW3_9BACT|nr:hypothetical protein GCM10011379_07070 [Filimonas zeae]